MIGLFLNFLIYLWGSVRCMVDTYDDIAMVGGGGLRPGLHVRKVVSKSFIIQISSGDTQSEDFPVHPLVDQYTYLYSPGGYIAFTKRHDYQLALFSLAWSSGLISYTFVSYTHYLLLLSHQSITDIFHT
jgi:hypothetical protein